MDLRHRGQLNRDELDLTTVTLQPRIMRLRPLSLAIRMHSSNSCYSWLGPCVKAQNKPRH